MKYTFAIQHLNAEDNYLHAEKHYETDRQAEEALVGYLRVCRAFGIPCLGNVVKVDDSLPATNLAKNP